MLLDRGRVVRAGSPDDVLDPAVIEAVYGIGATRTASDGHPQLLFHPLHPAPTDRDLRLQFLVRGVRP